jgi:hypothetical protein
MTVLIAGGDSFTYGSELPSQEHAWANLLADKLNMNICNTARPAASNSSYTPQCNERCTQVQRIGLICCSYVEFSQSL